VLIHWQPCALSSTNALSLLGATCNGADCPTRPCNISDGACLYWYCVMVLVVERTRHKRVERETGVNYMGANHQVTRLTTLAKLWRCHCSLLRELEVALGFRPFVLSSSHQPASPTSMELEMLTNGIYDNTSLLQVVRAREDEKTCPVFRTSRTNHGRPT
jgi:hypothetical protein